MANKYEMGSNEFTIPKQAKKHLSEKEFEKEREKYDAIEYETLKDEEGYVSKAEVSNALQKEITQFKQKKIGSGVLELISNLAA